MRAIIWIGIFLASGCVQADSLNQYPIKFKAIPDYVSVAIGVHPIRLSLDFMKKSQISGGISLSIISAKKAGITIGNHTKEQWKPVAVKMNQLPEMIFRGDFSKVSNAQLAKQLVVIREVVIPNDVTDIGYIRLGDITLYIAIGGKRSTVLMSSQKFPDMFTQIGIAGLSKKEIEDIVIQGVLQ